MDQYILTSDKGTTYKVKDGVAQLTLPTGFAFPIFFTKANNLPPAQGETVTFEREGSRPFETQPIVKVEKIA